MHKEQILLVVWKERAKNQESVSKDDWFEMP